MARGHLTISPAQAKRLADMGASMMGSGMIPQNFDEDDYEDAPSIIDFPVYVSKGRGKYAGHGGDSRK